METAQMSDKLQAEVYLEPCQKSTIKLLSQKSFIVDVRLSFKCVSEINLLFLN